MWVSIRPCLVNRKFGVIHCDTYLCITHRPICCSFDVESVVQKPYIHLIARSKASVKHQDSYLDERIAELKTVSTPLTLYGRTYHDVIRFQTGELVYKWGLIDMSFCIMLQAELVCRKPIGLVIRRYHK